MFLCYAIGSLKVSANVGDGDDDETTVLTAFQLWKKCREADPDFVQRYVAYHYYRAKGWVVKNGLNFGCDYGTFAICWQRILCSN